MTKSSRSIFGTDGIRGQANVFPITAEVIQSVGKAVGQHFRKKHSKPLIVIGKDTRKSGYMLEQALSSGICSVGVNTIFLGPLPTPGVAYMTRGMRANAGVMISASHNPYGDNGIKIFASDGYKLPDSIEQELEACVFSESSEFEHSLESGSSSRIDDAVGQYSVFLKERFPKELTLEGLKIALDCANGASYKVAPKVFSELGAEVFTIGCEPSGENINANCGALFPEPLIQLVLEKNCDFGFAFDGDADRLVAVDAKGEILDGDELLSIFAKYLFETNRLSGNTVVSTVMSNLGLEHAIQRFGGKLVRTRVGDRYVVEAMKEGGFSLGGEQSGHLVFRETSTTGDGILAALMLLEVTLRKSAPLNMLKKDLEKFPQILKNFPVKQRVPLAEMPQLAKHLSAVDKKLGKNGRVFFRYSGTELKARILLEGSDRDMLEHLAEELSAKATKCIDSHAH